MIDPKLFFKSLIDHDVDFFCGIPDSLLADLCFYIDDNVDASKHIIAANEGNAIALGIGYHMSTNKIPVVYMQNSGLGNSLNPLISLADTLVFKIPILLIIGWRGEPGQLDEPQHIKQGQVTESQLQILNVPYFVVDEKSNIDEIFPQVFKNLKDTNGPTALLIKKNTFSKYTPIIKLPENGNFLREAALNQILNLSSKEDLIISTTGKTSRELFELRKSNNQENRDFLCIGGMGHASSIALGVSIGNPGRRVICLDGDGSLIMHLGSMAIIGAKNPENFIHVLLNNCSHESVGGQATSAKSINFNQLAKACGYKYYTYASDEKSLNHSWLSLNKEDGPIFIEIKIKSGSRKNLGRPEETPEEIKKSFMSFAQNKDHDN